MARHGTGSLVGRQLTLTVEKVVHGGHCVARDGGRVVFVRHALPGEQVVAEVTEGDEGASYLRADAVEVLVASGDRVRPRCPAARPGGCGGCDFQHVDLAAQRRLLGGVVSEQLRRLAGLEVAVEVEPVAGDDDGLDWRTRVRFATDSEGRVGLRKHRSHDVVPLDDCPIAHPGLPGVTGARWPRTASVEAVVSSAGERVVVVEPRGRGRPRIPDVKAEAVLTVSGSGRTQRARGRTYVLESAAGRQWRVTATGFWQVHPGAADALTDAALRMLEPRPGEAAVDLYAGVGLFAGVLAGHVGADGSVLAVEGDAGAARDARRNLHDVPQVRLVHGAVARTLRERPVDRADVVLLDPPRTGAKRAVVEQVAALRPRAVCYVACDPAALARDVALFGDEGYQLTRLRAFDIFPMTHHVECVALLTPRNASGGRGVGR